MIYNIVFINLLYRISNKDNFMIGASFPNQRVDILVNPENLKIVKQELYYHNYIFKLPMITINGLHI